MNNYGHMRDLLNHDQPIYTAAREGIEQNLKAGLGVEGAAQGLRALVMDVFYDAYATMYEHLCRSIRVNYPVNRSLMEWTRERTSRDDLNDMDDWVALVNDLAEDLIDEYGLTAEKEKH